MSDKINANAPGYDAATPEYFFEQRIAELEKQLAERDAALARFSSVLSSVANAVEKEAFRMEAPNEHTPIFIGIANFARNNNCGLTTSAQATAKVLAAARRLVESWKRYDLVEKEGLFDASRDMDAAEIALYEAISEEQADRSSETS